mmetsp:Transcript_453/g.1074  ORF Transcript_453/g.1074 Transcript_453/m.1074 type:complete len:214 (+) Transcript_453:197-838(+)
MPQAAVEPARKHVDPPLRIEQRLRRGADMAVEHLPAGPHGARAVDVLPLVQHRVIRRALREDMKQATRVHDGRRAAGGRPAEVDPVAAAPARVERRVLQPPASHAAEDGHVPLRVLHDCRAARKGAPAQRLPRQESGGGLPAGPVLAVVAERNGHQPSVFADRNGRAAVVRGHWGIGGGNPTEHPAGDERDGLGLNLQGEGGRGGDAGRRVRR